MGNHMTRAERLTEIARIAVQLERETGLPACVLIAQWAVESRWGSEPAGQHNCFGMKLADRHSLSCRVPTTEYWSRAQIDKWDRENPEFPCRIIRQLEDGRFEIEARLLFADYTSLKESARDYAWLITRGDPYRKAWAGFRSTHDWMALLRGIIAAGYATAAYGDLAVQIANQANVTAAIEAARRAA